MKIYHCDENGSILWNEDPPMSKAYSLDENSSQKWKSSNVKKITLVMKIHHWGENGAMSFKYIKKLKA